MPLLRPGVGKQQRRTPDTGLRQPVQYQPRIVIEDPHIAEAEPLDKDKEIGDPVDIGLAADEPNPAMFSRQRGQMLAAAETDFEPYIHHGRRE